MKQQASRLALAAMLAGALMAPAAFAADGNKLTISGVTYTKWLWGDQRYDGSLYNFTSIPGEGYGDNGQGTELDLLLHSKPSKKVEVKARLNSRYSQNFWTNFGGFGNPDSGEPGSGECVGGDCGEFDSRSAHYIKFRGLNVTITPGYKWVDTVSIGANDFGLFDPFTIGKIRYIDRDNASGLLFQGSAGGRKFAYDFVRISLPRLWAGPNYATGEFTSADAAYGLQLKFNPSSKFDFVVLYEYVNDIEVDSRDINLDDGRDIRTRFRNDVVSLRFGFHPSSKVDVRGAFYASSADSEPTLNAPGSFFGISGFSSVPAGELEDEAWKLNVDLTDIGPLSIAIEAFDIGAQYVSMMAARREVDVLLTEGSDGTFAYPGPNNASFGVFSGNPTRIGYGGWQGNAQQVATINVDNEFTDFDEPMAETIIGWEGFTIAPSLSLGDLDLSAEFTMIDYNTNWQAWDEPTKNILDTIYPNTESDAGIGSFRNAYAPFQEKETDIFVVKGKYFIDAGNGIELYGKFKMIDEEDKRLNDAAFLPYQNGDCPGGGRACAGNARFYSPGNSTSGLYGNPGVVTVNGVTGYQWKPFDNIADDDRDMDYKMFQLGAATQLTDELWASLTFEKYDVSLIDGNTAFQAYQLHEMASGEHDKNKLYLQAKYFIGGVEFGFNYEYAWGEFSPDFGGGFVPQLATEAISASNNVKVGTRGFTGRFGGWNSLEDRDFSQHRLKAFMKLVF